MAASDTITAVTSVLLRISIYVFLRWIPTSIVPPLATALVAIYIPSFLTSFWSTSPYRVVSDEIDIITKETVAQGEETPELIEGAEPGPLEELDVEETIVVQEKDPRVFKTLLTGLPSPSSALWSWITFAVNIVLVGMMFDLIYRAPVLHPAHDLSFARVGYVSDKSAKLLVREPSINKLPIFVSYRFADPPLTLDSGHRPQDTAWKAAGSVDWLSDETDYTAAMEITRLRPDTRYQWALSNNHSGCIKPRVPYNPFQHPLAVPGFEHLAKWIDKLSAHFMLFLGDFIYIDVPIRHGKTYEDYRREYRQVYSAPEWPSVSEKLPWIHVLDDHEIENDWDKNVTGVFQAAYEPWRHYQVAVNPPAVRTGDTYFAFAQGPASFFLMDTRRYRDPEYEKDPWDSTKSMLGPQQLQDLLKFLREPVKAGIHWKIVVSSIPFTKNWRHGPSKLDTWGGYLAERQQVLEAMWDVGAAGGVGVIVLSGDRHEFAATAFPPPKEGKWPQSATVHEFSTSPLSMFYLPVRTYEDSDEEDVCLKYIPDGNSKFGAIEITNPKKSEQSMLQYRLFVDGDETWSYTVTTPPKTGGKKGQDSIWG
ncbi:Alkaline phosphatase D-related protein [Neofusicoccum parvum]|uniref:Alkaline phosphatase D-related protein n=1 Tax=Neofusicoccum parvum TaxID=310453 RepID=A0ACB5SBG7_9PEZI|nr:Alkaline phosphatase D-related protein [Neofusicoccum parvum]GME60547.1 Alkaline phosphatase D-related protein [Neofusicoccum parvum]